MVGGLWIRALAAEVIDALILESWLALMNHSSWVELDASVQGTAQVGV